MTDLAARLKNWRSVHLSRLHILMEEAADYVALLEAGNSLSHSGFLVLASAVDGMSGEIARLRLLSGSGDCPVPDNAANGENNERLAALQALAELDEELGLPRCTPATLSTPSEGSVHNVCTLTDAERAAVEYFAAFHQSPREADASAAATLRGLLERTK